MLSKLLTIIIGSHWRTFCGISREEFLDRATTTLDDLGYSYTVEEMATTHGERMVLGSNEEGDQIIVESPEPFEIEVITSTASPVTSFALGLFFTKDRRDDLTADLSVVSIKGIDETNRSAIATFVTRVNGMDPRPLWRVTHHVQFRLAILLRYKIRLLWRYWFRIAERTDGSQ